VVNQFLGHTHKDEFILFYDTETQERATSVGFFGPSLTPHTNLNLAYKIYTVDGDYDGSTRVRACLHAFDCLDVIMRNCNVLLLL
jgi:sphingomyelin phosphodiesterase